MLVVSMVTEHTNNEADSSAFQERQNLELLVQAMSDLVKTVGSAGLVTEKQQNAKVEAEGGWMEWWLGWIWYSEGWETLDRSWRRLVVDWG